MSTIVRTFRFSGCMLKRDRTHYEVFKLAHTWLAEHKGTSTVLVLDTKPNSGEVFTYVGESKSENEFFGPSSYWYVNFATGRAVSFCPQKWLRLWKNTIPGKFSVTLR